jgi:hypothetical protein
MVREMTIAIDRGAPIRALRSKTRSTEQVKSKRVACPRCGAAVGFTCQSYPNADGKTASVRPHVQRILAWERGTKDR